jgi:activating signal cointegrator 1
MKALSLWQPWASAIAVGAKRIETRSWATAYRGPILIHASKSRCCLPYKRDGFPGPFSDNWAGRLAMEAAGIPLDYEFPLGALIAVAELVGWERFDETTASSSVIHTAGRRFELTPQELALGDYSPGRYGWVLANVRALPTPIPYTGRQGLFDVPDAMLHSLGVEVA